MKLFRESGIARIYVLKAPFLVISSLYHHIFLHPHSGNHPGLFLKNKPFLLHAMYLNYFIVSDLENKL